MNEALLALIRKQFLEQGGSLDEFQDLVVIWESMEYSREMIAERFGGRQLHLIADCCEFLLRNLTPLEQEKILIELQKRLQNKTARDQAILRRFMAEKE